MSRSLLADMQPMIAIQAGVTRPPMLTTEDFVAVKFTVEAVWALDWGDWSRAGQVVCKMLL
jgi:hypothetical protein